jgi:hypothetical protein
MTWDDNIDEVFVRNTSYINFLLVPTLLIVISFFQNSNLSRPKRIISKLFGFLTLKELTYYAIGELDDVLIVSNVLPVVTYFWEKKGKKSLSLDLEKV